MAEAMTDTAETAEDQGNSPEPSDFNLRAAPSGGTVIAASRFDRVAERLHGRPNPVLGQSMVELRVAELLLAGSYEARDEESDAAVRQVARLAFAEYAREMNVSMEALEEAFRTGYAPF